MAEEHLRVVYDGPALAAGRMDVREFAPSVLAFADLLQEMQAALFPDDPRVAVQIVAHREGSFEVDLAVVHTLLQQARTLLAGDTAAALVNLTGLCGGFLLLVRFMKKLAGRVIARRERRPDGSIQLTLDDGTVLTTTPEVLQVFDRSAVRRLMRDFMKPLRREGVGLVKVEHRGDEETVTREERGAFEVDPEDEVVSDSTVELVMRIASLQFKPGNKWKLTDGSNNFWVRIEDPQFIEMIEHDPARSSR